MTFKPRRIIVALALLTVVPFSAAAADVFPQKSAILKCVSYRADGVTNTDGVVNNSTGTMNVKIDFLKLTLWIGDAFRFEILSLNDRSIVAVDSVQMEDGAELMVINRKNGSFQRSIGQANIYGTQRYSWSGSCSPTPF
jgi:hypothetical protein